MKQRSNGLFQTLLIIFMIITLLILQFVDLGIIQDLKDNFLIKNTLIRLIGGILLMIFLYRLGFSKRFSFRTTKKTWLVIVPALVVSMNNFPVIATLSGQAELIDPVYRIFLFFLECLSIGFFEEIIFRAILLIYLVELLSDKKQGVLIAIILSSILFGLMHLLNYFTGSTLIDTLMQVGYSTLLGMMWAVIYLKTKNIWLVMILHATYNFFGQVMFYLGEVTHRFDIYTIIITIFFAVIAAIHSFKLYQSIQVHTLKAF
ncbi:MAG: type II CAAX endopeptidase family protein [Acholeplasmataceae bacterium]|nr:type II CAAX endopeptidase family protein [Acholeplasmataceae bacterium]